MAVMAGANARHHPSGGVSHVRSVGAFATHGVRVRLGMGTSGPHPRLVRARPPKRPSVVGSVCSSEYFRNRRARGVLACSGHRPLSLLRPGGLRVPSSIGGSRLPCRFLGLARRTIHGPACRPGLGDDSKLPRRLRGAVRVGLSARAFYLSGRDCVESRRDRSHIPRWLALSCGPSCGNDLGGGHDHRGPAHSGRAGAICCRPGVNALATSRSTRGGGIVIDFVGVIVGLFDVRTVLIAGVIFIPLERLRPLHKGQHTLRKGWRTDVIYVFANGALLRMRLGALDQALGTDAALTNWAASGVVHPDAGAPKGEAVSLPPWVHCPNAKG